MLWAEVLFEEVGALIEVVVLPKEVELVFHGAVNHWPPEFLVVEFPHVAAVQHRVCLFVFVRVVVTEVLDCDSIPQTNECLNLCAYHPNGRV